MRIGHSNLHGTNLVTSNRCREYSGMLRLSLIVALWLALSACAGPQILSEYQSMRGAGGGRRLESHAGVDFGEACNGGRC